MNEEVEFTVPKVLPSSTEEAMVCSGYEKRRTQRLHERDEYKEFAKRLSLELPWNESEKES